MKVLSGSAERGHLGKGEWLQNTQALKQTSTFKGNLVIVRKGTEMCADSGAEVNYFFEWGTMTGNCVKNELNQRTVRREGKRMAGRIHERSQRHQTGPEQPSEREPRSCLMGNPPERKKQGWHRHVSRTSLMSGNFGQRHRDKHCWLWKTISDDFNI